MESIKEIEELLKQTPTDHIPQVLAQYRGDSRVGVQKLSARYEKKFLALEQERNRIYEMGKYERQYQEYPFIGGIDEVGRGPFAGPVVAACVILPKNCRILYINDSKKLTAAKREELYGIIMREAVSVGLGMESPQVIDEINILQATYRAMSKAVASMEVQPQLVLNDAVTIPGLNMKQVPLIHGDAKSISIAAASIVAKVTRDRMMVEFEKMYPGYDFASNKGYGSARHLEALKELGPCPIHRRSFIHDYIA